MSFLSALNTPFGYLAAALLVYSLFLLAEGVMNTHSQSQLGYFFGGIAIAISLALIFTSWAMQHFFPDYVGTLKLVQIALILTAVGGFVLKNVLR